MGDLCSTTESLRSTPCVWISQDSPERYEKPRIVFLIVCIWYDIKNIYLKETKCGKSPTTLVKEVGELAGQKNNNVNDGLNRHFEEVYKRQNVA